MKSALRTRKLYDALQQRPPTLHAVMSANPGIGINEAQEHFDNLLRQDKSDMNMIADMLYALVKWDSLLHEDRNMITQWINDGDARAYYAWIIASTSIHEGKAQDKLRVAYAKVAVSATDSPQALIRAMQTKWFLFKNNTMYARETQDGLKEGLQSPAKSAAPVASQDDRQELLRLREIVKEQNAENQALRKKHEDEKVIVADSASSLASAMSNLELEKQMVREKEKTIEKMTELAQGEAGRAASHGLLRRVSGAGAHDVAAVGRVQDVEAEEDRTALAAYAAGLIRERGLAGCSVRR